MTSNADAGPGTLRQALTDAAANGIAAKDYITFNITDVSEAGRTIILKKQLPLVTSNLEIDGSTQPGVAFTPGTAKIAITPDRAAYNQPAYGAAAFILAQVKDVSIYGFYISDFYQLNINIGSNAAVNAAFIIAGCQNIHIGAAGKGNTIINTGYDIYANALTPTYPYTDNSNFTFQANYIEATLNVSSNSGILLNGKNMLFGGDTPAEGNYMATPFRGSVDNLKISHNINGIDGNGDAAKYKLGAWQLTADNLEISYNTSVRLNCQLDHSSNFKIFGNVDTGAGYVGSLVAISMSSCTDGIIGAEDESLKNIFISNSGSTAEYITSAITNSASKNIQVLKNEIICSRLPYSTYTGSTPDATIPAIQVLVNNNTEYSGTASPLSDIYIYYDNTDCIVCSPVVFYTKAKADAAGNWKITGNFTGKKWAANALLITSSSEFTTPYVNETAGYYKITQPSCGLNNGVVELINYKHVLRVEWYNAVTNQKVGEGFKLGNLAPGSYYALLYNGNCPLKVLTNARLYDITPTIQDTHIDKKNATCNPGNGYIKGLIIGNSAGNPMQTIWTDQNNVTVSQLPDANKLKAGTYLLTVTDKITGCIKTYGPVTILNNPGAGLVVVNSALVTSDYCGTGNGGITGISVTGVAPLTFTWTDDAGQNVGATADLLNVKAGTYHLKIADAGGCELGLLYTVNDQSAILPAPSVADVQLCSAGDALLSVINPDKQYSYRLYESSNSAAPLDEQQSGKFKINVKSDRTYYISQLTGTCESSRAPVKISAGITSVNIANTFSPNGDGINDTWKINGLENYRKANVQIFTRSGEKVFESTGYPVPFNGTYQGKPLAVSTYYYIINLNSGCNLLSGSITIVR